MKDSIEYRGQKIEILGKGYFYNGWGFPTLAMVHQYIDNQLDGTKKDIIGQAYPFEEK